MNRTEWYIWALLLLFLVSCGNPTRNPDYLSGTSDSIKQPSPIMEPAPDETSLLETATKPSYPPALSLLDQLYAAGGDFRWERPALMIINTTNCLASFRPRTNAIALEEKAIEIARRFGKDSLNVLAAVLGHELTHFFQNKGSRQGEATNFLAYAREESADYAKEKEADLNGIFLAFVAGYKGVKDILPAMLDEIYKAYSLSDNNLSGYPTLKARKQSAVEVKFKADTLLHVFKAATYLTACGQYEKATSCFSYLLRYYDGAEALANAGTLLALQSLQVGGKKATLFAFPLEIDVYSRLSEARAEPLTPGEEILRQTLLQQAKDFFVQALGKMPEYRPALVGSICVEMMSGREEEALKMAEKNGKTLGLETQKLLGALALLHSADNSRKEHGAALLKTLQNSSDESIKALSRLNLDAIRKQPSASVVVAECSFGERQSYPGNLKPQDMRNLLAKPEGALLNKDSELKWEHFKQSELFIVRQGRTDFSFLVVEDTGVPLAEGLAVGKKFNLQQGVVFRPFFGSHTIWYSKSCRLLLVVDNKGEIMEGALLL